MNKLFQSLWYRFLVKFFPRKKESENNVAELDIFGYRMYWSIKIAKLFGLSLVLFGDSNAEEMNDEASMKRLPKVSVNIGIGGTRVDQWAEFFTKGYWGKQIYEMIKDKTVLANIIGNNVLQGRMDAIGDTDIIASLFKDIYWINVPKVWHTLFPRDITGDLKIANDKIRSVAGNNLIDIESVTDSGKNNLPWFFVQKDAVHFSDEFDYKVRIPFIKLKIYGIKIGE